MKKRWLLGAIAIILGLRFGVVAARGWLADSTTALPSPSPVSVSVPAMPDLRYQVHDLPNSLVYSLWIPRQGLFSVVPVVVDGVATVGQIARQREAMAVINGGFFDPENQQSTSRVMLAGKPVADPRQNDRLMQNPKLAPYLKQILNRSEFRRYRCQDGVRYAIARHQDPPPPDCELIDALGAGPRLLPELTDQTEGFVAMADGRVIRDAIGRDQPNARSAVGITATGDVIWVMVAQKPDIPNSGMTLPKLAAFLKSQGAEQALNLDGGSSTSFYYRGETFYGKLDDAGNPIQRAVKSVLLVQKEKAR